MLSCCSGTESSCDSCWPGCTGPTGCATAVLLSILKCPASWVPCRLVLLWCAEPEAVAGCLRMACSTAAASAGDDGGNEGEASRKNSARPGHRQPTALKRWTNAPDKSTTSRPMIKATKGAGKEPCTVPCSLGVKLSERPSEGISASQVTLRGKRACWSCFDCLTAIELGECCAMVCCPSRNRICTITI